MKYIIIGVVIATILVATLVTIILINSKKKRANVAKNRNLPSNFDENAFAKEPIIKVETIPAEAIPDDSKLVLIKDKKVLARIMDLIPSLAQIRNNVNNTANAIKLSGGIPSVTIMPKGAKLAKSRAMEGAYRGFYHNKGISGHADIVIADIDNAAAIAANSVATVMNIASMVVGQYYMNQVNSQLEVISGELSKISDFQSNEYCGRIVSLINHVKSIADFQVEIIENDELRLSKIAKLDNLEIECTDLLSQADLAIAAFANKNDINFNRYEKETKIAQDWYMYQQSLIEVLYQISDLKYALHLGNASREQCSDLLKTYINEVSLSREKLAKWHKQTMERLKIDTTEIRRKRDGIDGVMHFIPGLFNDKLNFTKINQTTIDIIKLQTDENSLPYEPNTTELYFKSVQLISKDGEIYYLPSDN